MSDLDPNKIRDRLVTAGDDWAEKKSAYHALDSLTKTVLAKMTAKHLAASPSKAHAEMLALQDDEYIGHLGAVADARKAWLQAEVRWKTGNTWSELRRSQESTKREELRQLRG